MIDGHFVWVGALLIVVGALTYINDVLRGRAQPNLVTWFLWTLAPLIAFAGQLQQGVGSEAVLTFVVGFGPALVFVAALKKGFFRLTTFDCLCGSMSLVALVLWQVTGNGRWAVALAILADGLAATPTIIKSFRDPHSESPFFFALFMMSAAIDLLATKQWTLESSAFAIYIFLLYSLLFTLVHFKIGLRLKPKSNEPDIDTLPS